MVTFIQLSGDTAQSDGTNHMTPIVGRASSFAPCSDAAHCGRIVDAAVRPVCINNSFPRDGKLVFEHYGRGEDEAWGRPLGTILFAPDVLHDLRSVSKSVLSLAYGIALAAGQVPTSEARLYDQFPEYPDLAGQPGRDRLSELAQQREAM
jgi:hypothetical protein